MHSNNQQQRQTQGKQREIAFAGTGRVFIQCPNDAALAGFTPPKQSSWIRCNVVDVVTIALFIPADGSRVCQYAMTASSDQIRTIAQCWCFAFIDYCGSSCLTVASSWLGSMCGAFGRPHVESAA
jgi:hypothetical protein